MRNKAMMVWRGAIVPAMLCMAMPTNAQTVDPVLEQQARDLYTQAKQWMLEGNFAAACPQFEEVVKLKPAGVGARLGLGECYEKTGRAADAWMQYGVAETNATIQQRDSLAEDARGKMRRVESKLILVTIVVEEEAQRISGLSVSWDGVVIESGRWGKPIPVDLGKHRIEAKAPMHQVWKQEFDFESSGIKQEIRVSKLVPVRLELKQPGLSPSQAVPPIANPSASSWKTPLGIVAMGLGAAGFVVGGVLGDKALAKRDASFSEGGCLSDNRCPQQGVDLRNEMLVLAHESTAALAFGTVSTALGIGLVIVGHREKKAVGMVWQGVALPGGFSLQGVW